MEIEVDSSMVRSVGATIKQQTTDFETLYNEIENNIRSMSNNWEGSSAESFYNEFNQLSPSFEAYKLALNEYGEFLNDAADMFESEISRSAATLAH